MITSIQGRVSATGAGYVVVELHGLGLRVEVPSGPRAPRIHEGDTGRFLTSFVVREDSMTLYGFETPEELEVFHALLKVSGVGPRSALGVLSELSPVQVASAVSNEDEKPFKAVSGIGPKTAKLILVSLAGKLNVADLETDADPRRAEAVPGDDEQIVDGLEQLGWRRDQAVEAVREARAQVPEGGAGLLMRQALANLQRLAPGRRI